LQETAKGQSSSDGTITLQASLSLGAGSYLLAASVNDVSGNTAGTSLSFSVEFNVSLALDKLVDEIGNFPPKSFGIEIVDGAGQETLTGRSPENLLKVRVFENDSPATPAVGVRVDFEVTGGGGFIATGQSLRGYTDGSGFAFAKLVAGALPGTNTVKATIGADNAPPPVSFEVLGRSPTITDVYVPSLCNVMGGLLSEYQGSAIPRLFKYQVRDNQGRPMKGESVVPEVFLENSQTPTLAVGYFLPELGITDDNGLVTFAFVIGRNAPLGAFNMEFSPTA
jgi:hypothetical protein